MNLYNVVVPGFNLFLTHINSNIILVWWHCLHIVQYNDHTMHARIVLKFKKCTVTMVCLFCVLASWCTRGYCSCPWLTFIEGRSWARLRHWTWVLTGLLCSIWMLHLPVLHTCYILGYPCANRSHECIPVFNKCCRGSSVHKSYYCQWNLCV